MDYSKLRAFIAGSAQERNLKFGRLQGCFKKVCKVCGLDFFFAKRVGPEINSIQLKPIVQSEWLY